jgi:DNA-binding ferritin-like protein
MSAIEVGQKALEDMAEVARQSESPRAYEVTTQLIKTLVDSNKDLLELAKKRNELSQSNNKSDNQNNVTNNNLFVTPTELLNMLRQNES